VKERERKGVKKKKTKVQPEPDDDGQVRESRADGAVVECICIYTLAEESNYTIRKILISSGPALPPALIPDTLNDAVLWGISSPLTRVSDRSTLT